MKKAIEIIKNQKRYYEKMLKIANQKPIDYAVGLRIQGQISILENLLILFEQEQKNTESE